MQEAELVVPSTMDAVAAATQQLRGLLPAWLADSERDSIELAIAEVLTNIVEHGYALEPGHEMRLRVKERPGAVQVDVWDRGTPIPRERLDADAEETFAYDPTDLARLPEGGMGLALIKTAFHEVRYGSREGVNRLQLVRRL